jgi:hypothetical protein
MKPTFLLVAAWAFLLLLSSNFAIAKNVSVGIYAIVDQVTFEPEGDSPNFVRISGVFVVPPLPIGSYRKFVPFYFGPSRGYLYFRITPGTEAATRRDWSEIKSFAGSGKVVGFGQYWVPNPNDPQGNPHHSLEVRVHAESGGPARPDFYPIPLPGVTEVRGWDKDHDPDSDKIAAALRDASHR